MRKERKKLEQEKKITNTFGVGVKRHRSVEIGIIEVRLDQASLTMNHLREQTRQQKLARR
jgi:hypothetical protein